MAQKPIQRGGLHKFDSPNSIRGLHLFAFEACGLACKSPLKIAANAAMRGSHPSTCVSRGVGSPDPACRSGLKRSVPPSTRKVFSTRLMT